MTLKELNSYYNLKCEIREVEEQLLKLGYGLSATKYDEDKVNKFINSESIQEKIIELKEILVERRVTALEKYIEIERYIKDIDDSEIRRVFQFRFINFKQWFEIDQLMHYSYGYSKVKINRFLKSKN